MVRDVQFWLPSLNVTLPIVITILIAAWLNNRRIDTIDKRFDDVHGRFDDVHRRFDDVHRRIDNIDKRLGEILSTLKDLDRRVTVLEERSAPIVRG